MSEGERMSKILIVDDDEMKKDLKKMQTYINNQVDLCKSDEDYDRIREKYGEHLKEEGRVEEALSGAMANYMFIGNFDTEQEARDFAADVLG